MNKYKNVRPAKGERFDTILDSYLYGLAITGNHTEETMPSSGRAWILDDLPTLETLYWINQQQGNQVEDLGLTDDEVQLLADHPSYIILEDQFGRVEVEAFADSDDAIEFWWEVMGWEQIVVSETRKARCAQRIFDKMDAEKRAVKDGQAKGAARARARAPSKTAKKPRAGKKHPGKLNARVRVRV